MQHTIDFLCCTLGSHEKAAELLGYSIRHYRKIRGKISKGEEVPSRIQYLIKAKAHELQGGGHACTYTS